MDEADSYWLAAAFVVDEDEELLDVDESEDVFSAGLESDLLSDFESDCAAPAPDLFSPEPSLEVLEPPRLSVR